MTQPVTIHARPHLNGNTSESFQTAGRNLVEAAYELEKVLVASTTEIFHGRNYQHIGSGMTVEANQMRDIDTLKVRHIHQWIADIRALGAAIYDAGRSE